MSSFRFTFPRKCREQYRAILSSHKAFTSRPYCTLDQTCHPAPRNHCHESNSTSQFASTSTTASDLSIFYPIKRTRPRAAHCSSFPVLLPRFRCAATGLRTLPVSSITDSDRASFRFLPLVDQPALVSTASYVTTSRASARSNSLQSYPLVPYTYIPASYTSARGSRSVRWPG